MEWSFSVQKQSNEEEFANLEKNRVKLRIVFRVENTEKEQLRFEEQLNGHTA